VFSKILSGSNGVGFPYFTNDSVYSIGFNDFLTNIVVFSEILSGSNGVGFSYFTNDSI